MCKSTGWVGEVPINPVLFFTDVEWEVRCRGNASGYFSRVSLETSLLLPNPSELSPVPQKCRNASKAKMLELKSFSAIRNPRGPFLKHMHSLREAWDWYTTQPGYHRRTPGFHEYPKCLGQEILAYIYVMSKITRLRECRNSICQQRRDALNKSVPRCGWPALEELAITILACWLPNTIHLILFVLLQVSPEGGRRTLRDSTEVDKHGLKETVFDAEQLPRVACLSVDGVIDLCRWVFRVVYGGNWGDQQRIWGRPTQDLHGLEGLLVRLGQYYDLSALQATKQCRLSGPCSNRLWNVSMLGAGGVTDLPSIASTALRNSIGVGDAENPHLDCTEQSCLFSHINSTLVPQHHICAAGNCGQVSVFPKEILNIAFTSQGTVAEGSSNRRPWVSSAWRTDVDRPSLCTIGQKYMAISHVWADGTGERRRDSGEANTCLTNYFSDIAQKLDCSGIWWDAISVPTGSLRTAAIDNMLMNYENAACTLVHDRELINFEWREDGSPAVALILSSWFTRGWTAAELWASRKHPVKVLFKNPDKAETEPLIKDLDNDILAWDPKSINSVNSNDLQALDTLGRTRESLMLNEHGLVPSYGHFIATDILQRLRDGGISGITTTSNLRDLLLNLRARVTSWVKDSFVIPGLMCLDSFDSNSTGPQITRNILSHFGSILCSDLFHGQVPVAPNGPWSWCPPSIFDLGVSHNSLSRRPATPCTVLEGGLLLGEFSGYTLKRDDVVVPFGRHPAVGAQISEALQDRRRCLLLTDQNDRDQFQRQFILACPVWVGWVANKLVISCQWAGCVYLGTPDTINPREGLKVSVERGVTPLEGLGDFNIRLHIKGSGSVRFLFGADTDENHQPLPPMQPDTVVSALTMFKSATLNRNGSCRWILGKETEQNGKLQWQRQRQPICIYPPNTSERLTANERDTHSSFCAMIDESFDHDAVNPSLLPKLMCYTQEQIDLQPCEINGCGCRGKVNLVWSFPHAPVHEEPILRRIFRSSFHVKTTYLSPQTDMIIGWMTYSKQIGPRCSLAQGHDDEKDKRVQILISSIRENSPDILDWNKPIRELEAYERGSKRRSLTMTFDTMLKDIPNWGYESN